jgi:hypothetical protein
MSRTCEFLGFVLRVYHGMYGLRPVMCRYACSAAMAWQDSADIVKAVSCAELLLPTIRLKLRRSAMDLEIGTQIDHVPPLTYN